MDALVNVCSWNFIMWLLSLMYLRSSLDEWEPFASNVMMWIFSLLRCISLWNHIHMLKESVSKHFGTSFTSCLTRFRHAVFQSFVWTGTVEWVAQVPHPLVHMTFNVRTQTENSFGSFVSGIIFAWLTRSFRSGLRGEVNL